jgi:hypothetical protein
MMYFIMCFYLKKVCSPFKTKFKAVLIIIIYRVSALSSLDADKYHKKINVPHKSITNTLHTRDIIYVVLLLH